MEHYSIVLTNSAKIDLRRNINYIKNILCEPQIAERTMSAIESAIKRLEEMPCQYPLVADELLAELGFHRMIVNNCVIFFTIDEEVKIVYIERIRHMRQDWGNLI